MIVALVQPLKPALGAAAEEHWELSRPFSLFYLAAALEQSGRHEAHIVDLEQMNLRGKDGAAALNRHRAGIYGITAATYTRFEAIRAIRGIRRHNPDAFVLAGGVHFMHCAEDTLRNVEHIDAVAHGEGEGTIVALADALERGGGPEEVPGLSFRRPDGSLFLSSQAPLYEDFGSLPRFERFERDEYPEILFGWAERLPALSLMASRGCPYNCIFCAKSGSRYRLREPDDIVDEMVDLRERFDVSAFNFLDLTFTASPKHVRRLCARIRERLPGIRWWCESRANIPLDLLETMRDAGCVSTVIGVESGDPGVLKRIGKNLTVDQVRAFCRECVRLGIVVTPYFMYSHPGESRDDARRTLDFISELLQIGVAPGGYQPAMIFPGTELERIARDSGALPEGFSWCEDYEDSLNLRLGQLPNIPIFRDLLDDDTMVELNEEYRSRTTFATASDMASRLSFGQLALSAFRAVAEGKPSARYLVSPSFYRDLIRKRFLRSRQ